MPTIDANFQFAVYVLGLCDEVRPLVNLNGLFPLWSDTNVLNLDAKVIFDKLDVGFTIFW